jgi:hypothetical protein
MVGRVKNLSFGSILDFINLVMSVLKNTDESDICYLFCRTIRGERQNLAKFTLEPIDQI